MSVIDQMKRRNQPPRREPQIEGPGRLGEITRKIETEDLDYQPTPTSTRPSDFAQPEVREAVANLEQEIGKLAASEYPGRSRDVGNSADMQRVKQIVENAVTAAHKDTCRALDKVVAEIQEMANRAKKDVEEYKRGLESGGQDIAVLLEATMQQCKRTVEWIEKVTPDLRHPKLEQKEEVELPNPIEK
jgi:uncharacterized protein YaaQ